MRYLKFLALAAVVALSTGCIRATYTLNLKPDGSGTIHQTMAMTSMAMQQASMMAGESGSLIPSQEKLREAAGGMGTGVRFVSAAPYKEAGFDGVTAIYAFDDIRTLALSMDKMMAGAIDSPMAEGASDAELKLAFARGPNATSLTLMMPPIPEASADDRAKAEAAAKQAGMPQEMPPEAEAMMKKMLDGLLFEVALNIDGTIVSTNAPYRAGNKIVLLQLNGTELIKGGLNMGQMMNMSAGQGSLEERLRTTPGVKIVTQPELKIEFK